MNDDKRHHILCAVRSRPSSEQTAARAIELALEQNARLTFFHALETRFLDKLSASSSSRKGAYEELAEMLEFTLSILADQARAKGVKEVDFIIRQGDFREELLQLIREMHMDILVIGRPRRGPGQATFTEVEINAFLAELQALGVTIDN
jgi:nucleotide-binding universal stress UspA family protein